uniref:Uncharacterized protein n=1 Tax=Tetranychus urticae TaxID=32264 RepID=T1KX41_TETUR
MIVFQVILEDMVFMVVLEPLVMVLMVWLTIINNIMAMDMSHMTTKLVQALTPQHKIQVEQHLSKSTLLLNHFYLFI